MHTMNQPNWLLLIKKRKQNIDKWEIFIHDNRCGCFTGNALDLVLSRNHNRLLQQRRFAMGLADLGRILC